MKKLLKLFLSAALLFVSYGALKADCCDTGSTSSSNCGDCDCSCRSTFIPRSAGDNLVRQATYKNYEYGEDCFYGNFSIEYRYQRSREDCRIARSLFGSNVLHFQGSNVANRAAGAIIADNFGLAADLDQKISFAPRIQNHIVDFELYLGLNELWDGLFLQFNAPLVHTKWALNPGDGTNVNTNNSGCCDNDCNTNCNTNCGDCSNGSAFPAVKSTTAFGAGCMDAVTAGPIANAGTVAAATTFCGTNGALSGNFKFGDMQTAWIGGSFCGGCLDETKLASFNMILGYNFWDCADYHFGIYLKATAPTGTDDGECCIARNVFQPRIGDNHWKFGAGLTGHAELYNCDDEHMVNMYLEGYVVHLFDRCQVRSFDFKDKGCLSRYMLLKEFNAANTYAGNLISGINYTTRRIETSVSVQGEGIIEFVYSNDCGFSAGIGYNIYGHSCEEACGLGTPCATNLATNYGFKGCAPVEGVCATVGGGTGTIANSNVTGTALNSTQSKATITACGATDNPVQVTTNPANVGDPFADGTVCFNGCTLNSALIVNPSVITRGATAGTAVITPPGDAAGTQTLAIRSELNGNPAPVYVSTADIDINSGLIKSQVTNKIFGHLDYEWTDCDWTPRVYIGGEVEFASSDDCQAMNAWGVYVGAAVSF